MNLEPIVPEARPVVEKAAAVYIHHTRQDFVGLIVHGSALKGGFIAGCSDVDLQLYVMPNALDAAGHLPFELTVAIHRDLARIDPAPFRYIQCYAFSTRMRDGWVGPVPGAYHVVAGRLPIPEATGEQLGQGARASLAALNPVPSYLTDGLLDHGGGRLEARVRLLCTEVWPALYHVLIVRGADPARGVAIAETAGAGRPARRYRSGCGHPRVLRRPAPLLSRRSARGRRTGRARPRCCLPSGCEGRCHRWCDKRLTSLPFANGQELTANR